MMKSLISASLVLAAVFAAGVVPPGAAAAEVKPLAAGARAPDFDLPGVDGKRHTLADYKDAKVLVVLFTCNHCPTAQAYEDRIIQLHNDYAPKGVALVAISPNDPLAVRLDELGYSDLNDTLEEMKLRAEDKRFPFPYLYDGETQAASRAYGAVATPQAFVFDAERTLRYQGRIDDAERDAAAAKSHDLRDAIDALLAGKAPAKASTNVFGCSTKWADKRDDAKRALAEWDREEVALSTIDADAVKKLVKADGEKAPLRLVNVWATWCAPCIAEMPELTKIHRMYRKRPFELVTISIDDPADRDAAHGLLKENHLSATNHLFDGDPDALVGRPRPRRVARPGAAHAADRARRQGAVPRVGHDRRAQAQASRRRLPRPHVRRQVGRRRRREGGRAERWRRPGRPLTAVLAWPYNPLRSPNRSC
jgi:thiol-disulfide isomerase/thioredoxin